MKVTVNSDVLMNRLEGGTIDEGGGGGKLRARKVGERWVDGVFECLSC